MFEIRSSRTKKDIHEILVKYLSKRFQNLLFMVLHLILSYLFRANVCVTYILTNEQYSSIAYQAVSEKYQTRCTVGIFECPKSR